jgi:osmotically-inducible protein OsmY
MRKTSFLRLAPPAMAGALALAATVTLGAAQADEGDARLGSKAKLALLTTDGVSATALEVDAVDGVVTIHGKVSTLAERARAEAAVRRLDGVREVRNRLKVVPQRTGPAEEARDESIKEGVEGTLALYPLLKDVKVASVTKGVVLLVGRTANLDDTLKAVEYALACPGVRGVTSEIVSGS